MAKPLCFARTTEWTFQALSHTQVRIDGLVAKAFHRSHKVGHSALVLSWQHAPCAPPIVRILWHANRLDSPNNQMPIGLARS